MDFLPFTAVPLGEPQSVSQPVEPERLLLTVQDTARLLSVGPTTVKALIREGALGSVKIGASRRITRSAVERYIEELQV